MEHKEHKQMICNLLCKTLWATRGGSDIKKIVYQKMEDGEEYVQVKFIGGGVRGIRVTADSGTAMIRDIMAGLGA